MKFYVVCRKHYPIDTVYVEKTFKTCMRIFLLFKGNFWGL